VAYSVDASEMISMYDDGGSFGNCLFATVSSADLSGNQVVGGELLGLRNEAGEAQVPVGSGVDAYMSRTGACPVTEHALSGWIDAPSGNVAWKNGFAECGGTSWCGLYQCNTDQGTDCGYGSAGACSGQYLAHIENAENDCFEFVPMATRLDLVDKQNADGLAVEQSSTCTPGTGEFVLVPTYGRDRDHDGKATFSLAPVLLSGSGVLTRRGRVSRVTRASTEPNVLRVITSTSPFSYTHADSVAQASAVSTAITGTVRFGSGRPKGMSPFVIEEVDPAFFPYIRVEMDWTCDASGPVFPAPPGYRVSLAALGCDAIQQVVLRPEPGLDRLTIEPVGAPALAVSASMVPAQGVETFEWVRGPLELRGAITAQSADTLTLRLDALTLDSEELCQPGTYSIPAE